jgi:hypothetical protein
MKTVLSVAAIVAAATMGSAAPAFAADPPKALGPTCNTITYDQEFLKAYPRAPAACQEVVESNGKRAARYTAKVVKVQKDHVQLHFMNSMGSVIDPPMTLTLLPQAGQTLQINGKPVAYDKLAKGDKVDFWIPEKQLGIITDPNKSAVTTIVVP